MRRCSAAAIYTPWPMSSIRWRMSGRVSPTALTGRSACLSRPVRYAPSRGVTTTLLTRAADVALKERRRLVLMVREAPLHAVHIRNMLTVTEIGGIIHPPVPAFYTKPRAIGDIVDHSVARALDCFGLEVRSLPRWGESPPDSPDDEAEPAVPERRTSMPGTDSARQRARVPERPRELVQSGRTMPTLYWSRRSTDTDQNGG